MSSVVYMIDESEDLIDTEMLLLYNESIKLENKSLKILKDAREETRLCD